MQLGINLWVWGAPMTDDLVDRRVAQAAEMGYDVVEFPFEDPGDFDYELAGERVDDHGLDASLVVAMSEGRDLLHDDPEVRANGRDYLRESVDAAAAIGSDRVVGPTYSAVGRTWLLDEAARESAYDDLAAQLGDLADYAAERDVALCVEPLNRYETSVINVAEQAVELVDRIDHPACEILLDTYHMNIEENSLADAIRATGDRLGHLHACGSNRCAPGHGTIDWDPVVDALDDVGYDDQAVIESFTPEVESIARAASIWRPLAESQDALAEDGLASLRSMFGE